MDPKEASVNILVIRTHSDHMIHIQRVLPELEAVGCRLHAVDQLDAATKKVSCEEFDALFYCMNFQVEGIDAYDRLRDGAIHKKGC